MRVACPSCGREIHAVARHCKHCHAVLNRFDVEDAGPVASAGPSPRRWLPIVAIVLASAAIVLLAIAVLGRGAVTTEPATDPGSAGSGSASDGLGKPAPQSLTDVRVVEMFVTMCHHHVGCGVGTLQQCELLESTMKQMPRTLAPRACAKVDWTEARKCIEEIPALSCARAEASLDVLRLQQALDRVRSCRRACE